MEFPRSELATELVISFFSQSIQQWAWNDEEYENICNYKDVCCFWRAIIEDRISADIKTWDAEKLEDRLNHFIRFGKVWAVSQIIHVKQIDHSNWSSFLGKGLFSAISPDINLRNRQKAISLSMTELLLKNGADPNYPRRLNGANPSDFRTPLWRAVDTEDTALIELLLDYGALINPPLSGSNALARACWQGFRNVICSLIEWGGDLNEREEGETMLQLAVRENEVEVAELLIQSGAYVNALAWDESTALHDAVRYNRKPHTELLLNNGADLTAMSSEGHLPLHEAAMKGYVSIVDTLLNHGADVNAKSADGRTALHFLAQKSSSLKAPGRYRLLRLLIEMGVDIDAKDKYGFSATGIPDSETGYYFESLILVSRSSCPGKPAWEEVWKDVWTYATDRRYHGSYPGGLPSPDFKEDIMWGELRGF